MNAAARFREAVEAGDFEAAVELFSQDVRFYSPVKFTPFEGIDAVRALFRVLQRTFTDFRYVGDFPGRGQDSGGAERGAHVLHFRAVVDGKQVEGIDLLHLDDEDRIATFTVMLRPMSAVQVVSDAVYAGLTADGALG
ncbi:nuclear transport factor 2 family protein [Saccharopolyspora griseoalba]|uniref:Nuclear transport factor 2 family protein n=1 Tax=Saccharopolyspora griseoalba TaxID=1431848 RepID=A0ABW2LCK9_9PSEU